MVRHAFDNVPYYRRHFDRQGLRPDEVCSLADLERIPLTSKQDLQAQSVNDTLAAGRKPEGLIARWTEGSTGAPFTIRRTLFEELLLNAFRLRAFHWGGMKLRDRRLFVAAAPDDSTSLDQTRSWLLGLLNRVGFLPHRVVDAWASPAELGEILRRYEPDIVGGYPSSLAKLTEHLSQHDAELKPPRYVGSGGETLTPDLRQQIEEGLRARVYDSYGANEINLIAYECPQTGEMHVMDDTVIVEVLNDGRPAAEGERGEVVVTALHSFAMPFIRYRLEDSVIKGKDACGCGKPFSTIRSILGRTSEYFPLPGGREIHAYDLMNEVWTESWVRRVQIIQERRDRVVVRLVPADELLAKTRLPALKEKLQGVTGSDVEVVIVLKSEIPSAPAGKSRIYISLVNEPERKSDAQFTSGV
jgi:phenylacetate-CoA ligase